MLYYRATSGPRAVSVLMVRTLTAVGLIAYPAGALTLALGPKSLPASVIGYGLILAALVCYGPLIGSSIQRVVGEQTNKLDEYELRLRGRAMNLTYAIFSGLALMAILYSAIASDKGFWVPRSYDEFNGLFWGVFLYASVLPAAVLSWLVEPTFEQE